jgi:hypothetical protein
MRMVDGKTSGIVHVSWARKTATSDVRVHIKVEMKDAQPVTMHVYLPDQELMLEVNGPEFCFSAKV